MLLEPVIVECPHCKLKSQHYSVMSGTIHRSHSYTDGKMVVDSGAFGHDPFLIKCRNCQGFYLFCEASDMASREEIEELDGLDYSEEVLKIEDYKNALIMIKDLSPDNERFLRMTFWWKINNLIRGKAWLFHRRTWWFGMANFLFKPFSKIRVFHPNFKEYKKWTEDKNENLEKIIPLLYINEDNEDMATIAEIHRELGDFKKAKYYLRQLPQNEFKAYKKIMRRMFLFRSKYVHRI
jgi:hypothetical protein